MSMGIRLDEKFQDRRKDGIDNPFMRQAVSSAQNRLRDGRLNAAGELGDWEAFRDHSEEIRQHVLEHLDYYLYQLSDNISKRGGNVFFAETPEEANRYIREVVRTKNAKHVVKSKSMVTEEIGLNEALHEEGCTVVESDLGEWILQLDNDPPSHIVAPALHKDRNAVHETFTANGYEGSNDPTELGRYARRELRKDFLKAEVGITGCNFAIAESGAVGLVTNEGNGRMVTSLPDTVISVMGMERIVPSYEEFEVLVNMLCRSAVGQRLTSYITTFAGTRGHGEVDGPEEFHLVIVDNKRSGILGTQFQSVLQCIRCAACINVCPVYRHIGGHAYGSIYPGPIGAVLAPLLEGYENYKELPYASSLCGACTEACPVKIPLHELLIEHRRVIVEEKRQSPFVERIAMKGFAVTSSSPFLFEAAEHIAPFASSPFTKAGQIDKGLPAWTDSKDLPQPAKQTVRDWFKKRGNAE